MNELSLFSGAGGGLLGTMLLGFRPIGYVEWDDYCQRVLAVRIRDGILPDAPIFGDIKTFISDGYAASYTGMVDVLSAGFPCQPFSVAGQQRGAADERNMWPFTIETIRIVRPRFVFLENVPGLLSAGQVVILIALEKVRQFDLFGAKNPQSFTGRFIRHIFKVAGMRYFGRVLGDLAESGYDAEWTVLGADDCGAPHRRKRVWILAHSIGLCGDSGAERTGWEAGADPCGGGTGANMAHDANQPFGEYHAGTVQRQIQQSGISSRPTDMANPISDGSGPRRPECEGQQGWIAPFGSGDVADTERVRGIKNIQQGELRSSLLEQPPFHCGDSGQAENGERQEGDGWWSSDPADTICVYGDDAGHGTGEVCGECESSEICGLSRWGLKSRVGRVVNGCPDRIHRLKALGNMQVASVVASAYTALSNSRTANGGG